MMTRNFTLLTDLYELTMMQGYYKSGNDETVIFDVFYRDNPSGSGYAIAADLSWSLIISKTCLSHMKILTTCEALTYLMKISWNTLQDTILPVIFMPFRKALLSFRWSRS